MYVCLFSVGILLSRLIPIIHLCLAVDDCAVWCISESVQWRCWWSRYLRWDRCRQVAITLSCWQLMDVCLPVAVTTWVISLNTLSSVHCSDYKLSWDFVKTIVCVCVTERSAGSCEISLRRLCMCVTENAARSGEILLWRLCVCVTERSAG